MFQAGLMRLNVVYIAYQLIILCVLTLSTLSCFKYIKSTVSYVGCDKRLYPREFNNDVKKLTQHRVEIARQILTNESYWKAGSGEDVEIRVLASDRKMDYLIQVMAFLAEGIRGMKANISICNVENDMFDELKLFQGKVPIFQVNDKSVETSYHLDKRIAKESNDYWKCLSYNTSSRHILLVEDDALVVKDFPKLLKSLIVQMDKRNHIDYVKLYHPINLRKIPDYIMYIAIVIMLPCLLYKFFSPRIHWLTIVVMMVLLIYHCKDYGPLIASNIRFRLTGSAYITIPESCCTPAVLFRTSQNQKMFDYFKKQESYQGHAKDHILDESPFVGRQTALNFVTHIGGRSSIRLGSTTLTGYQELCNV